MFRVSQHPSSGVLKTVTAASGTGHNTGTATALQRGPIGPRSPPSTLIRKSSCMFDLPSSVSVVRLFLCTVQPDLCIPAAAASTNPAPSRDKELLSLLILYRKTVRELLILIRLQNY